MIRKIFRIPEFLVQHLPLTILIALFAIAYRIGIGNGTYGEYVANSILAILALLVLLGLLSIGARKLSEFHWGE